MFDLQFRKSFHFRIIRFTRSHINDVPRCPVHYLAQLICGSASLVTPRGTVELAAGDYFYIPKGTRYQSRWRPDDSGQVAFYSFGFENLPLERSDFRLQKFSCSPEEAAIFGQLTEDMEVSSLSLGRLYTFFGLVSQHMEREREHMPPALLEQALEYMRSHEHAPAGEIAAQLGISESGLYALFRKNLGKTPVQVRHGLLVEQAVTLLVSTDHSIEEIAGLLGFSSASYFRKIFKAETGKNPLEVRKNMSF